MKERAFAGVFALALLFCSLGSSEALALGKRPHHGPSGELPLSHFVPNYSVPEDSQAFPNYDKWDHSHLPAFLQIYHCAGMALFSRQMFNFTVFDPTLPKVTDKEYRKLLRKAFNVPTPTLPGTRPKRVIPGYTDFNEMTRDPAIEEDIKDILGDALGDILRANWNWSPLDVFGSTMRSRSLIELNIRETVSRDRVAMLYLTSGFKSAHSVLAYGYDVLGDRVRYTIYDSNHPDGPTSMDFVFSENRFDHPDFGMRDPWILHPYADEFTSTRAYINAAK